MEAAAEILVISTGFIVRDSRTVVKGKTLATQPLCVLIRPPICRKKWKILGADASQGQFLHDFTFAA